MSKFSFGSRASAPLRAADRKRLREFNATLVRGGVFSSSDSRAVVNRGVEVRRARKVKISLAPVRGASDEQR